MQRNEEKSDLLHTLKLEIQGPEQANILKKEKQDRYK